MWLHEVASKHEPILRRVILGAFKNARSAADVDRIERLFATGDRSGLSALVDVQVAMIERQLNGSPLRTASRFRAAATAQVSFADALGATQAAAGAGAAQALCKQGIGKAAPLPSGAQGVLVQEIILLRQQGLSFNAIAQKLGWTFGAKNEPYSTKVRAIIKKYAPHLLGKVETAGTGMSFVPKTALPKTGIPTTVLPTSSMPAAVVEEQIALPGMARAPKPQPVPRYPDLPQPVAAQGPVPFDLASIAGTEATGPQYGEFLRAVTNNRPSGGAAQALSAYKHKGYREINRFLRTGDMRMASSNVLRRVKQLDAAFYELQQEITVYRGGWRAANVGDVFVDRGFISTSLSKQTARSFSGLYEGDRVVWKITIPRGSRVAFPCCRHISELEIMLARGSRFRVTGISTEMQGEMSVRIVQAVLESA